MGTDCCQGTGIFLSASLTYYICISHTVDRGFVSFNSLFTINSILLHLPLMYQRLETIWFQDLSMSKRSKLKHHSSLASGRTIPLPFSFDVSKQLRGFVLFPLPSFSVLTPFESLFSYVYRLKFQ